MYWLVARPILSSPYWGDDHGDSQLPMQLQFNHQSFFNWWLDLTEQWTSTTGRFFPLNVLNGSAVYYLFQDRSSYKMYQFAIVALALVALAVLIGVIARSKWAAFVATGVALMTLQMKPWFDPFWQFAGQQSMVNILSCCALVLAVIASRRHSRKALLTTAVAGACAFAGAILTYESSILLVVAIPLLLFREAAARRTKVTVFGVYFIPTIALFVNLLYQRSKAVVTNPGYTVSLDPHAVFTTFKHQMVAALPLSYRLHTADSPLPPNAEWPLAPAVTFGVTAIFIAAMSVSVYQLVTHRTRRLDTAALAGLIYWAVPSLFVAISLRWQSEVRPGVGYIPVMAGGFAFAWLMTLGLARVSSIRLSGAFVLAPWSYRAKWLAAFAVAVASATGLVCGLTASSNKEAVSEPFIVIDQVRRDAYVEAVRHGLYSGIDTNSYIGHRIGEWWNWENAAFSSWYGAPRQLQFVRPEDLRGEVCATTPCYYLIEENPRPGVITYHLQRY